LPCTAWLASEGSRNGNFNRVSACSSSDNNIRCTCSTEDSIGRCHVVRVGKRLSQRFQVLFPEWRNSPSARSQPDHTIAGICCLTIGRHLSACAAASSIRHVGTSDSERSLLASAFYSKTLLLDCRRTPGSKCILASANEPRAPLLNLSQPENVFHPIVRSYYLQDTPCRN
jgi:hypothetical protein